MKETDWLDRPVSDLGLCIYHIDVLKREGFTSIRLLTERSESEMYRVSKVGRRAILQIRKELEKRGLGFRIYNKQDQAKDIVRQLRALATKIERLHDLPPRKIKL